MAFHLAWHTKYIATSIKPGNVMFYLLVPCSAPSNRTLFLKTAVISDSGCRVNSIDAFVSQLACLRSPDTSDGILDPDEQALIARLTANAASASRSLPEILPTTCRPSWSRATVAKMTRLVLIRSAGVD